MSFNSVRILVLGSLFTIVVFSGFWLSHIGKPYNILILTLHKLTSLGALIFLVMMTYKINQVAHLGPFERVTFVIALLFFLMTIVTGGLLSAKSMPTFVLRMHQIAPFITLISTAATMVLQHRN